MKFRLVDKITAWSPYARISGVKTVSFEESCLKEALGEPPRLTETLLLESFLQLGNWLILLSSDFQKMGMVARLSEVRFEDFLRPGERLWLEAHVARRHEDSLELCGRGRVGERTVISGLGCVAVETAAADYLDPEAARVLFSEIYDPNSPTG